MNQNWAEKLEEYRPDDDEPLERHIEWRFMHEFYHFRITNEGQPGFNSDWQNLASLLGYKPNTFKNWIYKTKVTRFPSEVELIHMENFFKSPEYASLPRKIRWDWIRYGEEGGTSKGALEYYKVTAMNYAEELSELRKKIEHVEAQRERLSNLLKRYLD